MRSLTVAVRARAATPPGGRSRAGRLVRVVSFVTLICLIAVIGIGMVANPWYRLVSVEGGSMEPAISRGDLIVVGPAPTKVEPGMILVLRVDGQLVTHRVVEVNPDGTLVTRGDANGVDDAWGSRPVSVEGEYLAHSNGRVVMLDNPAVAISSSALRTRARAGRSLRYLVPAAVAAYVARHGLYRGGA